MANIKFYKMGDMPLELHKVRVVQKLHLVPINRRLDAMNEAGFNTFRLSTKDVFLDMLTDSGTNAMSDNQVAAMFQADDAYAGSQSFERLQKAVYDVLGKKYLLPVHQGRAAENVICHAFVKPGNVVPTNYHFTTTLAHVMERGGTIEELYHDRALVLHSDHPFKGNMDIDKLEACIQKHGVDKIPFVRMEASTNLIGGQPFSIRNMMDVRAVCDKYGIMLVPPIFLQNPNMTSPAPLNIPLGRSTTVCNATMVRLSSCWVPRSIPMLCVRAVMPSLLNASLRPMARAYN